MAAKKKRKKKPNPCPHYFPDPMCVECGVQPQEYKSGLCCECGEPTKKKRKGKDNGDKDKSRDVDRSAAGEV